ncbi:MAG: His/Gly/Thr/Pro-type tRNA ligase C-terminal domain-containing protein [Desulfobacteraceae bacterium]
MVGESELQNGAAVLRNMTTKEQQEVPFDGLEQNIIEILK